jgi:hypothetical protein
MSSDNNTHDENSNNINNEDSPIENTFTPVEPADDNNTTSSISNNTNNVNSEEPVQISTPSPASSRRTSKTESTKDNNQPVVLQRKINVADSMNEIDWFKQREYIIFKNELTSQRKINNFILKECKENKRLLDLKYNDLTRTVNNIQTSVIFVSTLSGFLQATKVQFGMPSEIIEVISITISTYISLILSISKYYKLDELKEQIQNLREKYSLLHNKIEHRMDVLGPWNNKYLWEYKNASDKLAEWRDVLTDMNDQYKQIIETKQELTTEFEIIMDTISRNKYNGVNAERNYNNRMELFQTQKKETSLETQIIKEQKKHPKTFRPSIVLQHEALDNWEDEESVV